MDYPAAAAALHEAQKRIKANVPNLDWDHRSAEHALAADLPDRMTDLLTIEGLRTAFRTQNGEIAAVDGVDLSVAKGRTLGIVGESGCGKSILSLSVMRLVPPPGRIAAGRISFDGRNLLDLSAGRDARTARQPHRDDLPGADDQPEPGVHRRRPDHRGDARARPHRVLGRAARPRDRRRWRACASLRRSAGSTNIRTRCPAACASA